MKIRKSIAAVTLAGAALFVVTGCSDSSDTVDSAASKVSTAVESAATAVSTAVEDAVDEVTGLSTEKAQEILRKAVDANTPADEIDSVVDTSNPATKTAIIEYAKASNGFGYTPDIYTVKEVKKDGDKAVATVAVKSPHAPAPVDVQLTYVDADGWKLSADAVTQLSSIARGN
ncbi:DUF4878 domain-containing protein [Gordonia paraffinivorans]|uniref:DUF4878 domain-containing protein n=1 Tax=Gordonia paraffinivorans TaxID=175628 RepID=UPI0014465AB7|nr:DUF4878 domain-containing protein [Gordonia paraffinivorans]